MSKKSKIAIKLNEDLVAIDEELDDAISGLDNVNTRIVDMLEGIESGGFEETQVDSEDATDESEDSETPETDSDAETSEVADEEEEFIDDDEDDDDDD